MTDATQGSRDPIINNLADLCAEVAGARHSDWESRRSAISKRLFKATECGIIFDTGECTVRVAGYVEGGDVECEWHQLEYPFKASEFWAAVTDADKEGVDAFDTWHAEYNEEFC